MTGSPTNFNVAEPWAGYVRIKSDDAGITPLEIPFEIIPGFITVGGGVQREAHKWVVNCPVPGGALITSDVVLDVAQTVAGEVQINFEFSDGGSPFAGGQLHMKCGEPPATLGTADNGSVSLDDIEIKATKLHAVIAYAMQLQPTADESCQCQINVSSQDFAVSGPMNFSTNSHPAGIANSASGGLSLTVIETDRTFRVPMQKQTVSATATVRDAMAGNGRANWCLVYS